MTVTPSIPLPKRGDRAICHHCGEEIHWVEDPLPQGGYSPRAGWFHTTHFMRSCLNSSWVATPRKIDIDIQEEP